MWPQKQSRSYNDEIRSSSNWGTAIKWKNLKLSISIHRPIHHVKGKMMTWRHLELTWHEPEKIMKVGSFGTRVPCVRPGLFCARSLNPSCLATILPVIKILTELLIRSVYSSMSFQGLISSLTNFHPISYKTWACHFHPRVHNFKSNFRSMMEYHSLQNTGYRTVFSYKYIIAWITMHNY